MKTTDIREARKVGDSTWEILARVIEAGAEFPDAVWTVTRALSLDAEEVEEMERGYDECC